MNPTIGYVLRGPHTGRTCMLGQEIEGQVWVNFNYTQRQAEWDLVPVKDIAIISMQSNRLVG